MTRNEGVNWYRNRYPGHDLPDHEVERKWRAYLFEEEQLRLAEAFAMKQAQAQASTAAYFLGAPIALASMLGAGELILKPIIYFFHERFWYKFVKIKK